MPLIALNRIFLSRASTGRWAAPEKSFRWPHPCPSVPTMSNIASSIGFRVARGLFAGVVATAVMSAHMLAEPSTKRIGTPPPQRIADLLFPGLPARERRIAATVIHVGIGASSGMLYRAVVRRKPGMASGLLFGFVVYAIGYEFIVPALGLLPPAHRDSAERRVALLEAHAAYGATLGALSQ